MKILVVIAAIAVVAIIAWLLVKIENEDIRINSWHVEDNLIDKILIWLF